MTARSRILARARQVRHGDLQVPSPCLSVYRMETDSALCAGCFRTLEEIAAWGQLSDGDKRVVWQRITERASVPASEGGPT